MDPDRKRKIRLVVALTAAVLLATALVYTSFSASTEARSPAELLAEEPKGSSEVFGTVVTKGRDSVTLRAGVLDAVSELGQREVEVEGVGVLRNPVAPQSEV